jgi:hypothetical protein
MTSLRRIAVSEHTGSAACFWPLVLSSSTSLCSGSVGCRSPRGAGASHDKLHWLSCDCSELSSLNLFPPLAITAGWSEKEGGMDEKVDAQIKKLHRTQ